jgi:hypothetical protein
MGIVFKILVVLSLFSLWLFDFLNICVRLEQNNQALDSY